MDTYIKNFINGKFKDPISGNFLDNFEPATGEVYTKIPDSDEADVQLAVKASEKAFPAWSTLKVEERSAIIGKVADLIEGRMDEFVQAESKDTGKPLTLAARMDIPRAVSNFRFFSSAIIHFSSESHHTDDIALNYTLRTPIGIVGCISPWNLPLYLFSWKIAPALAAGNCVIAKPSEITPMTAFMLSELCNEAGLPKGVLNIVHGLGSKVGAAITKHPLIKAISFTGGTKTGEEIANTAAPMFKKLSLEMGGKNPNIIFADCNFDQMIESTLRSSFTNQGQICLCGSRIFIEESLYEQFKAAFVERTKRMKLGDPMDDSVDLGAISSAQHKDKVMSYIDLAKEEGGTVLAGGSEIKPEGRCANGWFIEPTIIEGLPYDCRTNMEEIFGPVVTIMPFKDEEQVIQYANATSYGLSATVWTENLSKAHRVSREIMCGIVWVNTWLLRDLRTPFGGFKNSGVGREGGWEVLRFFTEPKNVCIRI